MEAENKVNWDAFAIESADRVKPETEKKYGLGFNSVKQSSMDVVDKEKTDEGKIETKKTIPTLILGVDYYGGKPCKKEFVVTSKKLCATIRTYFEKGMLFTRVFQLERSGEGYQTSYSLIALEDKPTVRPTTTPAPAPGPRIDVNVGATQRQNDVGAFV